MNLQEAKRISEVSVPDRANPEEVDIEVSAVMPCLNEARTLAVCIGKALNAFARLGIRGEVVVADNGSTDGSPQIAEAAGARVVHQPVRGYGAALMAGLGAARGRYLIMGDADDSYDWSSIDGFVDRLRHGKDVVIGNRFKGGISSRAMPWHHRYIGNPILSLVSRVAFRIPIGDFHCGMRAFTREAFRAIRPETTGMEFATELIANAARAGLKIDEIPIELHADGRDRPPHLRSFRDGWRHLRFIITYAPDHLYLAPGFFMLITGLALQALLATGPTEIAGHYVGIHFLALGGLLALLGFNVISMGVHSKVLLSLRYPSMCTGVADWALRKFKLEYGLLAGLLLIGFGGVVLGAILFAWLGEPGRNMHGSVHPSFAAAQSLALGVNIAFASFMLQLIRAYHSAQTSQTTHSR